MEQCLELYQIDPNIFIGNADKLNLQILKENNITHVVNVTKNNDITKEKLFSEFSKEQGNYLSLSEIDDSLNQDLTEFIIKNFHFLDPLIKNEVDNRLTVSKETNVGILIISSNGETEYLLLIKNKKDEKWMIPISEIKENNIVDEEVIKIFKTTTGMDFPDYELYDHYDYSYHQFTNGKKKYNILQINIDHNKNFDVNYRIESDNEKLKWLELDDADLRYNTITEDYQIISKCLENMELNLKNKNKSIFELDYKSENTKGAIQTINTEKAIQTDNTKGTLQTKNTEGAIQTIDTEKAIQTENDGISKGSIKKGGALIENINNKKKAEGDSGEEKKKLEPCSILSFQNSKDCTCPDGARAVNVNIGSKSEGYMCPKVPHGNEHIRSKQKEYRILFYEKEPFNVSLALLTSYYIISQNMKYEEIKNNFIEKIKCNISLSNTNFIRQLLNLEKIINISSIGKYKKTLKKKRFTLKKSLKKKNKPHCSTLSLQEFRNNSNVECTCYEDEREEICGKETSEPRKCCIKSILKKNKYKYFSKFN